ncbi:MAG: hypothetical protein L0I99_00040 [Micrococcaceae bacterium]|nr:hypothetical protein [Micrococcaceae bacterium]
MFSTSECSRPTAVVPGRKRTTVLPRLMAVTAVGFLSLTACSNADGAGDPSASSSPGGTSESAQAQESASQDTGMITEGAADEAWKEQARKAASKQAAKRNSVDPAPCVDGLLDQKTLDAVATAIPEIGGLSMSGLYTHVGCGFTATDPDDEDLLQAAAEVQIRRYYLANDEEFKTLNESGYLKHGQCADTVETDENGVSTVNKHGVKESKIPGPSIAAVDLQAAWHCSADGATTSAVLIHAAEGEEDRFTDPTVLTEPDLAVEMATHLSETESDWAPQMDEIYEKNFKDAMGQ